MFPKDKQGFTIDDQYFIGGSGLLVRPVTEKGVEEVRMYLPENQVSRFTIYRLLTLIFCSLITTILPITFIGEVDLVAM